MCTFFLRLPLAVVLLSLCGFKAQEMPYHPGQSVGYAEGKVYTEDRVFCNSAADAEAYLELWHKYHEQKRAGLITLKAVNRLAGETVCETRENVFFRYLGTATDKNGYRMFQEEKTDWLYIAEVEAFGEFSSKGSAVTFTPYDPPQRLHIMEYMDAETL